MDIQTRKIFFQVKRKNTSSYMISIDFYRFHHKLSNMGDKTNKFFIPYSNKKSLNNLYIIHSKYRSFHSDILIDLYIHYLIHISNTHFNIVDMLNYHTPNNFWKSTNKVGIIQNQENNFIRNFCSLIRRTIRNIKFFQNNIGNSTNQKRFHLDTRYNLIIRLNINLNCIQSRYFIHIFYNLRSYIMCISKNLYLRIFHQDNCNSLHNFISLHLENSFLSILSSYIDHTHCKKIYYLNIINKSKYMKRFQ